MITTEKLVEALKQVFDPEIPINVYDLGLIYEHRVNPDDSIYIKATMTSPACPYAGILLADLKSKVKQLWLQKAKPQLKRYKELISKLDAATESG